MKTFGKICTYLLAIGLGIFICVGAFVVFGIVVGDGLPSEVESVVVPVTVSTVPATLVMPTLTPESTTIPVPTPTSIPLDQVQVYGDSIMDIMTDWATGYSQFSELFTAAGNDISLLDDPTWLGNVYANMDLMTTANVRLRAITPPEQFVPSHQSLLEAATHTDTAISLLRTGIATKDIPTILAATEQISLGTEDIKRATALLDEITL